MQFRCWKFWLYSCILFLTILTISGTILGKYIYKSGIRIGIKEGYRYGWYDRHLRIPYVKHMKCGRYWKNIEESLQEDWNIREKTNGFQEIQ